MSTGIRLTAHDFLNKLRKAGEGRVYSGLSDWADDIRILVVEPSEERGIFLAPAATTFKSNESFTRFVEEIERLTEPSLFSESKNRIIKTPKGTERISAIEFINRLKHAENCEINLGHVGGNFEIALIVTNPAEACGMFMAPRIDAFNYEFDWYSEVISEITKLLMTPPEERKMFRIRTQLPWIEGLEYSGDEGNNDGPDQG